MFFRTRLHRSLAAAVFFVFAAALIWSEDSRGGQRGPFFFRIDDVNRYFFWGLDLIPTGLEVTGGYSGWTAVPGVDTILQSSLSFGYEGLETYRDVDYTPHVQIPPEAAAGSHRHLEFNCPLLRWELGVVQRLLWSERLGRNCLEAFLFYRGRYERYLGGRHYQGTEESRIATIEAYHDWWKEHYAGSDAEGIFGTSFLAGVDLDTLAGNKRTKAWDGYYVEASFEASPYLPAVPGATDFFRATVTAKGFKTLYEAPSAADRNRFTIYLGGYFSVDYAYARRAMPTYVMQAFGGRNPRDGLGDSSVRGFEGSSWDTQLKIVNNLDLRFNLPPLHWRDLVPGFLVYFDLGYGDGFWGDPSATPGALLSSTGLAVYVDLFDLGYVQLAAQFPLIRRRLDGRFCNLDLDFNLHF